LVFANEFNIVVCECCLSIKELFREREINVVRNAIHNMKEKTRQYTFLPPSTLLPSLTTGEKHHVQTINLPEIKSRRK
jgi:hypothetical protein